MKQRATPKSKTNLSQLAERPINENIVFGIDVGIASCGWAVIDTKKQAILAMGSRCFEAPEEPDNRKQKNAHRREKRGMRRVTSRRADRLKQVRRVIEEFGLLDDPSPEHFRSLKKHPPDPWQARIKGLSSQLTPNQAAAALIHIAKHRGFKSNSKHDAGDTDGKNMLKEVAKWEKLHGERTYAQGVIDKERKAEPDNPKRRRNREGDYRFTPPRDMLLDEAKQIIALQRQLGAGWATCEFEKLYISAAFYQRDLRSSECQVGFCPFEPGQKHTSKSAYSFERFRFVQTLVHNCKVESGENQRHLTPNELQRAMEGFGQRDGLTFKQLAQKVRLAENEKFVRVKTVNDEKSDVTGAKSKASPGTYALYKSLRDTGWDELAGAPEILDRIAEILTHNNGLAGIRERIQALSIAPETVEALMESAEAGAFKDFSGTADISAKAARKLIPHMLQGKVYSDACKSVGYPYAAAQQISISDIRNATVQRALTQAVKQVELLVRKFGRPKRIGVELVREVGKSAKVRGEIDSANKTRASERERNRENFVGDVKGLVTDDWRPSDHQLERYELMKEQGYKCPFCNGHLTPDLIISYLNPLQTEHIYPKSRSQDDSYVNKVVACTTCNQNKKNMTPWEWMGGDEARWRSFEARINTMFPSSRKKGEGKKREKNKRLLDKTFAEREQSFLNRNLVDAQYIARALRSKLTELYPESYTGGTIGQDGGTQYVQTRPGRITAELRRAWLKGWKKDRKDDRHHAMDALIVALTDQDMVSRLTNAYKWMDERGLRLRVPNLDPPWPTFTKDALDAYCGKGNHGKWLVCRTENRRARGALHKETFLSKRIEDDGSQKFYKRIAIGKLKTSDLDNIKDHRIREAIEDWIERGKPKSAPPRSANGDEIRKLRLPDTKIKTAIQTNSHNMGGKNPRRQGGYAENPNGSMVRVDVFSVNGRKQDVAGHLIESGYHLVPVYLWQIADKSRKTPLKAIVGGRPENEWPEMNPKDFAMSLYPGSYIEVQHPNGSPFEIKRRDGTATLVEGYYRGTNIHVDGFDVSPHNDRSDNKRGEPPRKIENFRVKRGRKDRPEHIVIKKFQVDRLGTKRKVRKETWPGHQYDK